MNEHGCSSSRFSRASLPLKLAVVGAGLALLLSPLASFAQTSSTNDKWIHVRVTSTEDKGETVKVNVPLDMAEKILPAINKDRLHNGKVTINHADMNGVDCKAILDAVRTAKDGEFVTVQSRDNDVRVAKQGGFLLVYVTDKSDMNREASAKSESEGKPSKMKIKIAGPHRVELKVPMKVVDALFSTGKADELDVLAAIRALSSAGDIELVSVKDDDNTVRVWIDAKNVSD